MRASYGLIERRLLRSVALAWAALVLAGCIVQKTEVVRIRHAGDDPAGAAPASTAPGGAHTVARGETLYSIAFRNGVDWRDLAAWNRLAPPYTIYPGQRLHLSSATGATVAAAERPPAAASPPLPASGVETRPLDPELPAPVSTMPPRETTATPPVHEPPPPPPSSATPPVAAAPPPAPPPAPASASTTTQPPASPAASVPRANVPTATVGGLRWRWPTEGEVIQRYTGSDLTRQGIDIAGRSGQIVAAAADGEVVYSGSGLRGYGELIIIKHSPEFLSAYGHNRKRLVNEGQRVQAGQPIAEMGRTGADRDKLHFEIRRNGKPADPLTFLPKR